MLCYRIITSDWGLADWVQRLIGTNRVCYASEMSKVDPTNRTMEMHSRNLTFCSYVNMEEKMTYSADPGDRDRTLLRQEMIVTVQGVPLTSYMEGIIVNTVSNNSSKGKAAIEWVVDKLSQECRYCHSQLCRHHNTNNDSFFRALNLVSSLDKLKSEITDLKHSVAESLILPAKKSIEELQGDLTRRIKLDNINLDKIKNIPLPSPPMVNAEEQKSSR